MIKYVLTILANLLRYLLRSFYKNVQIIKKLFIHFITYRNIIKKISLIIGLAIFAINVYKFIQTGAFKDLFNHLLSLISSLSVFVLLTFENYNKLFGLFNKFYLGNFTDEWKPNEIDNTLNMDPSSSKQGSGSGSGSGSENKPQSGENSENQSDKNSSKGTNSDSDSDSNSTESSKKSSTGKTITKTNSNTITSVDSDSSSDTDSSDGDFNSSVDNTQDNLRLIIKNKEIFNSNNREEINQLIDEILHNEDTQQGKEILEDIYADADPKSRKVLDKYYKNHPELSDVKANVEEAEE